MRKVRQAIRRAAPDAVESISYRMPAYKLHGKPLVYFAAFTAHLGMYPMTGATRTTFAAELARYKGGKGTVQFPFDEPLPLGLIRRIVQFRAREIRAARPAKKTAARKAGQPAPRRAAKR
ncbi:MAG: DUF1801 domain-containing protein [Pirellulales bacterium]|nr:DUF1801 domain-containing protein [Pirellulales bacterium]